jgi:Cdc6-like AAA superfamily ATPase
MKNLQNTQIANMVHKLPTQSKLILLATILHDKHFKRKYLFQRTKLKEIYEIYLELCKKTFVNSLDKKRFTSIALDVSNVIF